MGFCLLNNYLSEIINPVSLYVHCPNEHYVFLHFKILLHSVDISSRVVEF